MAIHQGAVLLEPQAFQAVQNSRAGAHGQLEFLVPGRIDPTRLEAQDSENDRRRFHRPHPGRIT